MGDQLASTHGTAQLFEWTSARTTCLYLFRVAPSTKTLNGVLCFNVDTCAVCAFDYPPLVGSPAMPIQYPAWSDLLPASAGTIDNCSNCHNPGTIAPKLDFKENVEGVTIGINDVCSEAGGPLWIGAPASWAQRNNGYTKVTPPKSCKRCHAAFVKHDTLPTGSNFCTLIVQAAFTAAAPAGDGGSMVTNVESKPKDCVRFAKDMGCDESYCPPTPTPKP